MPHFSRIKGRYPFLVLEGPSGTGKTSYAKNITGNPQEVLEVNCAATPEPDLREFDSMAHTAILFRRSQLHNGLIPAQVVPGACAFGGFGLRNDQLPQVPGIRVGRDDECVFEYLEHAAAELETRRGRSMVAA